MMTQQLTRKRIWSWGALGVLAAALMIAAVPAHPEASAANNAAATATAPSPAVEHANTLSQAFREASEKVMPSVVMIQTTISDHQSVAAPSPNGQQIPEELLRNPDLRRFFHQMPQSPQGESEHPHMGMGSGVIIDPSGVILTNNHVVSGGDKVMVRLHDGRQFVATDVMTDPMTDIAVIRIEGADHLQAAELGDSDSLQIGDWVMAVGAPFGLRETVTAGIISAKSRGLGITQREEFLQTDAAINPGNSGGPLVNLEGQVVGINTAISSTSGGYQGIGFAVPIDLAKWVSDQLVAGGAVQRAFLGVGIQEMTMPVSQQLGLNAITGALVNDVRPDSPAAKAGLQTGDVIVEFDGVAITTPRSLQGIVERAKTDVEHTLVVLRDGKKVTLKSSVDAMPAELTGPSHFAAAQPSKFKHLGIEVGTMNADIARKLGFDEVEGVLITRVKSGSLAALSGLEEGMVISKVGTTPVKTLEEFAKALEAHPLSEGILLLVRTSEGSRFIVLNDN